MLLCISNVCSRPNISNNPLTNYRIGAAFQKPNLLKYTRCMGEAAESLKQAHEYESDKAMSRIISLRQVEEHIQETLFTADTAQLSLSDGRTLMHLRSIEAQLDAWKAPHCYSASSRRK